MPTITEKLRALNPWINNKWQDVRDEAIGEIERLQNELDAANNTIAKLQKLENDVTALVEQFKKDGVQGYRNKDRQAVILMLGKFTQSMEE